MEEFSYRFAFPHTPEEMNERQYSLDIGKLTAAWGVILIHLAPSISDSGEIMSLFFSNWVIPFFFTISLYIFHCKFEDNKSALFSRYARRLILPYVSWTLIYFGLRLIKGQITGQPVSWNLTGLVFFGEASVQLYFLPKLLLFLSIHWILLKTRDKIDLQKTWYRWGIAAFAMLLYLILRNHLILISGVTEINLKEGPEFLLYLSQLFTWSGQGLLYYLIIQLLIATRDSVQSGKMLKPGSLSLSAFIIFVMMQILLIRNMPFPVEQKILCGSAMALFLLKIRIDIRHPLILFVLTTSYGVYLIHHGVIEAFEFMTPTLNWPIPPYSVPQEFAISLIVLIISVCCVFLIRRFQWTRQMLLGESRQKN